MDVRKRVEKNVVTEYVASDGTVFGNEYYCKKHELELAQTDARDAVEKMPHFEVRPPLDDIDMDYTCYKVKDKNELENIKLAHFEADCTANDFEVSDYPAYVIAEYNDEGYGSIWSFDEIVSAARNWISSMYSRMQEAESELQH